MSQKSIAFQREVVQSLSQKRLKTSTTGNFFKDSASSLHENDQQMSALNRLDLETNSRLEGQKKRAIQVEQLVKEYFTSKESESQSKFTQVVEKLDFENKKLQEKHISQKQEQQQLTQNAEQLIDRVETLQKQLEMLKGIAKSVISTPDLVKEPGFGLGHDGQNFDQMMFQKDPEELKNTNFSSGAMEVEVQPMDNQIIQRSGKHSRNKSMLRGSKHPNFF